mmetsp:Transcript_32029/g.70397  ORF Transcript_32029/g.70397 Transcript_32029/m.70397 type:complete len:97 (+) Transcript_32029:129-419(+)
MVLQQLVGHQKKYYFLRHNHILLHYELLKLDLGAATQEKLSAIFLNEASCLRNLGAVLPVISMKTPFPTIAVVMYIFRSLSLPPGVKVVKDAVYRP